MRHDIWFSSAGSSLAGHLYIPDQADCQPARDLPAVVVAAPGSGIKEQTSGRYAQELCDRGFVALAFDHRTFGESEGWPRYHEDPYAKSEDIKNAVSFLGNRSEVDENRIGAMGICGGGGYAPYAAATDRRIRAVATVSGMTNNRASFEEVTEGDASALQAILDRTAAARQSFSRGGLPLYDPVLPDSDLAKVIEPVREAPSYYFTEGRGAHPRWENRVLAWSVERQLSFNALDVIDWISPRPILFIVGSASASRDQNEKAYAAALEPKKLSLIEGATHIDLYDVDQYVTQAAVQLAEFFNSSL